MSASRERRGFVQSSRAHGAEDASRIEIQEVDPYDNDEYAIVEVYREDWIALKAHAAELGWE